ncbi:MAG: T9SS type A sorting domain-containing protein [Paludibacter sp.]|nr:T9SS type A sorting domain-containing protein [Paludibacter sp.]
MISIQKIKILPLNFTQKFIGLFLFLLIFSLQSVYAGYLSGTYYIDAVNGNDTYSGKTEDAPLKSFDKINANLLTAGTKIMLKRGSVWNKRLEIRGSGIASSWISVGAYGSGEVRPKISLTNARNDIALLICDLDKTSGSAKSQNISYIQIKDLEIANTRLGIYYRSVTGTVNTGFKVQNVIFNNINCDTVMTICNTGANMTEKNAQINAEMRVVKGNLQTVYGDSNGGSNEYIFPAAIFVGGSTFGNQTVTGNHTTVLTEFEVSDCQFNECMASIMSVFYWPFVAGGGSNVWRQVIHKVRVTNCTATGAVNGAIAFDGVNGGAIPNADGVMQPDADGWGLIQNMAVTRGSAEPGRTWPNGTTGVILSNCQNFLFNECEFSNILNQGNPDGCGFDFETNVYQVTIQNSKFFNNDGHAILMMDGGAFGGCSKIVIQKNIFAGNIKSSTSVWDFYFSRKEDGHTNVRVNNNISFLPKKNKENKDVGLIDPTRTYVTATDNEVYYLDDSAQPVTVSFMGNPYTYKAIGSVVAIPVINTLTVNDGNLLTDKTAVQLASNVTKGAPAYYKISEKNDFSNADWVLYNVNVPFQLSSTVGLKTIYFKVKNLAGESSMARVNLAFKPVPEKLDAVGRTHVIVAPNPVISQAKFSFVNTDVESNLNNAVANEDVYQVTVTSIDGKVLKQSSQSGKEFTLDFSDLPQGTLFVRMVGLKNTFTKKVIKK